MIVERRGWRVRGLKLWLPLGFFLVFTLFPFYWMAITSLKPNSELYSRKIMPLIVYHPTLEHFVNLLTETSFLTWTYNTMLVAVVSTAISLVFGVMLAYPLARMRFAGAALSRSPSPRPTWCRSRCCSSRWPTSSTVSGWATR